MSQGLAYGLIGAGIGYFTGGRAKKAKRTKAVLYGIGAFLAVTQVAPRFNVRVPRLPIQA